MHQNTFWKTSRHFISMSSPWIKDTERGVPNPWGFDK